MVSTVTTSIIATILDGSVTGLLTAVGFFLLLALLIQKELSSVIGPRFQNLVKTLDVAIIPLLMAIVSYILLKIVDGIQ